MATLTESEIEQRLADAREWRAADESGHELDGGQPKAIVRERTFEDFAGAIAFINRVADVAEQANHHPDILLHAWNKVRLTLSTHSQGGLTEADFRLAAQLDQLD
jgi:4a-hydroxytetrahydrobiopterin dehydratase